MSKKRQALYTVLAYPDSLATLNLTIEGVAKDFQEHFGCECEWALHDKDDGKKSHYHFDCGFASNVPTLAEFLNYCESDKYVKKNAIVQGQKGISEVRVFAVTHYNGSNGTEIQYNHVIQHVAGRDKYLMHTSKSSEQDGKYKYDKSIIHSTPDFDLNEYYSYRDIGKKAKAERAEERQDDPFIDIFNMVDKMHIDNVAQLIAICLKDKDKHWCIPFIKADLMKYNVLINGFVKQREWEHSQMIGQDGLSLPEKMNLYHEARKLPDNDKYDAEDVYLEPATLPEPESEPEHIEPESERFIDPQFCGPILDFIKEGFTCSEE